MRFWFLIAGGFTLIIFSAEISVFLSNFFAHKLRHVLAIFLGIFAFVVLSAKPNETGFRNVVSKVSYYAFFLCLIAFSILWISAYFFEKVTTDELWFFLIFSVVGFLISILFDRIFTPQYEKIRKFCTKKSGTERDLKTDIRHIQNNFESVLKYDPQQFFTPEKWFFGLDSQGQPIYFSGKKLRSQFF